MSQDDARKAILARRARFVRAAVLGVGLASCEDKPAETPPMVCLSVAVMPPPTAPPASPPDAVDAGADAGVPPAPPTVCLRIAPPSR